MSEHNSERKGIVCLALGEIGRSCSLPLPDGKDEEKKKENGQDKEEKDTGKKETDDNESKILTKLSLVNSLVSMVKTSNETNKIKERAAMCLGDICVGDKDFPHRQYAMNSLFNAVTVSESLEKFLVHPVFLLIY